MLEAWIAAFLCGVAVARVAQVPWAVDVATYPALAVGMLIGWAVVRALPASHRALGARVASLVLGGVWGLGHAAPIPDAPVSHATVVKVAVDDAVRGPAIVRAGVMIYEVSSVQIVGTVGDVRTFAGARLFATHRGVFTSRDPRRGATGLLATARDAVRAFFAERMESLTPFYRSWLAGLVLGESAALPPDVRDAFKRTGLYHLLVVSGLHVSLMALLLAALLRAPIQASYALRLVSPGRWRHIAAALDVLAGAAALLYLAVTGSSAAAQRSALLFAVWQGSSVFAGPLSTPRRLLIAGATQILLFPVGFLGEATLMSWAAYLLVLKPAAPDAHGLAEIRADLISAFKIQGALTLLVTVVFGQLAWIGLVANLVLIPAFPALLLTALGAAVLPELAWTPALLAVQRSFIALVRLFDELCRFWPWLSIAPEDLSPLVRVAAAPIAAWILLNRCRDLTISRVDP